MVVIAIVSILANIAIYKMGQGLSLARDRKRISEIDSMAKALELYRLDNNNLFPLDPPGGPGCWGYWTAGTVNNDPTVQFLPELVNAGYFQTIPLENAPQYLTLNSTGFVYGNWDTCSYRYAIWDFSDVCPPPYGMSAVLYTVLENPPPGNIGRQPSCLNGQWGEGAPGNNDYLVILPED
jgi:type II secretory pathway pseudopilin PulG